MQHRNERSGGTTLGRTRGPSLATAQLPHSIRASLADVRSEPNWHWASGAAVALVAAGTGLSAHLALRAASDGSLGRPVLLLGTLLLALILWPLAARTTSVAALTA